MEDIIDNLHSENNALLDFLDPEKQPSLYSDADNKLKKFLVMSIASQFEVRIQYIIRQFAGNASKNNLAIISLIEKKVIFRQYHTYFKWETSSVASFLSLFGTDFKQAYDQMMTDNPELKQSGKDFMELGQLRNELAHQNFAAYSIEKTGAEIYRLYKSAVKFVDSIEAKLLEMGSVV